MKLNADVESFDDISTIHREDPSYNHCIRVVFKEGMPENEDEATALFFEQKALVEIFGDKAPSDLMHDWRDEQELWVRYNVGASIPTLQPDCPLATRKRLISIHDVAQLRDFDDKDLADWLEHFKGYPEDEKSLASYEEECFIDSDPEEGHTVCLDEPYSFKTFKDAYIFFVANYYKLLQMHDIVK